MAGITTIAKIRYNPRGAYEAGIRYSVDDMVQHLGSFYRCIVEGTTGTEPTLYDGYNSAVTPWEKLSTTPRSQGTWDNSTTYRSGDLVGVTTTMAYRWDHNWQETDTYICLNAAGVSGDDNYPPKDSDNWKLFSKSKQSPRRAHMSSVVDGYAVGFNTNFRSGPENINYRRIWDAKSGAGMNEFAGSIKEYAAGGVGIVSLTAGGTGYATDRGYPAGLSTASVIFSGGGGHGATGVAYVNVSTGVIRALEITDPGRGYSGSVSVEIRGGHAAGVSTSQATATAYAWGTTPVAPSEYFNRFGNFDTTGAAYGQFSYFNRLGSMMSGGYSSETYGMGTSAEGNYNYTSEQSFVHKEWYEGVLPTPDGLPPKPIQCEDFGVYGKFVLFNNGEIHYMGYNGHGQAGDNTTTVRTGFIRWGYSNINKSGTSVLRGKKAIRIACTGSKAHGGAASATMVALIENPDGTRELWGCGYNGYGQLAQGNTTNRDEPIQMATESGTGIGGSNKGKFVGLWAAGGNYGQIFLLTDQGYLFTSGYNGNGHLGVNDGTNRGHNSTYNRMYSQQESWAGTPLWTGDNAIRQFEVVAAQQYTAYYVVTRSGELWSWGYHNANYTGHGVDITDGYIPFRMATSGMVGSDGNLTSSTVTGFTTTGVVYGSSGHNAVRIWSAGAYSNTATVYLSVATDDDYEDYDYAKVRPVSDSLSSAGVTTAVGTGYNGTYDLSLAASTPSTTFDDDFTATEGNSANVDDSQNLFVGMSTTAGYQMKDVTDFITSKNMVNYTTGVIRCVHQNRVVHYLLPYHKGTWTSETEDANYNVVRDIDPEYLASNYVAKPIPLFPTGELSKDQTYINVVTMDGEGSGYASFVLIDQRSGTMYYVGAQDRLSYGLFGLNGTEYGMYQPFKFLYH